MGLKKFLNNLIDAVIAARDVGPYFPPFPLCPICKTRTQWFREEGPHIWGCSNGHRFDAKYEPHAPDNFNHGDFSKDGEI